MIAHPLTGEVLPDDIEQLSELEAHVDRYLREQSKHYAFRRALRARIAELRGAAVLPRPRWRSPIQQTVAECPRCGTRPDPPQAVRDAPAGAGGDSEPNPFHEEAA